MTKVKWWERLCYGLSAVGGNLPNYLVVGYLTLFATDVMGVDAVKAGSIILTCTVFDAVTDLIVTNIADRTQSPWGKYRPWLLFTSVPMAAALVLLFWYPGFLVTQGSKLAWLAGGFFLLSPVFQTGYLCPQYVLLSVITGDEGERLRLGSARSIGEFVAELMTNGLWMPLVLILGGGDYRNAGGWRGAIVLFAVGIILCCMAGFFGTRERVRISNENLEGGQLTMGEKLKLLLRSPMLRRVLLLNAGIMLATVESVLFPYYCIYHLGHEQWLSSLCTAASLASIAATAALPGISERLGKRGVIRLGCLSMIVSALFCLLAKDYTLALIYVIFKGIGYGFCISCGGVLWATVSDHIESETGMAIPGLVMATGSFTCKILMGICTFLGTGILTLAHYDGAGMTQSAYTLSWIRNSMVGFLLLAALVTLAANASLKELHSFSEKE